MPSIVENNNAEPQPWTALSVDELTQILTSIDTLNAQIEQNVHQILFFRSSDNKNALHYAAMTGNIEIVRKLLELGLSWNLVDDNGLSIGEVALNHNHQELYEFLVDEGVRCEFILSILEAKNSSEAREISNKAYLESKLVYSNGLLVDGESDGVMMGWEKPLMKHHRDVIAGRKGLDILNIGFGLGIIDTLIQESSPNRHVIVEAHPDVYAEMVRQGWDKNPSVEIKFARWQDVINELGLFDGIFFDSFGENYDDLKEFHESLSNLMRDETSCYSYFNGLAGTNPFFHSVASRICSADLQEMGIKTEYIEIDTPTEIDEKNIWDDVKRKYYSLEKYRIPICKLDI